MKFINFIGAKALSHSHSNVSHMDEVPEVNSKDDEIYCINPNNVSCVYSNKKDGGTYIRLNCGLEFYVIQHIEIVTSQLESNY